MKPAIACILILIALCAGSYSHLYFLHYAYPAFAWIPEIDQDAMAVVAIQFLFVLPVLLLFSSLVAVFHKRLTVPLALPLPALLYAAAHEAILFALATFRIQPKFVQAMLNSAGEPFVTVLFFAALVATISIVMTVLFFRPSVATEGRVE